MQVQEFEQESARKSVRTEAKAALSQGDRIRANEAEIETWHFCKQQIWTVLAQLSRINLSLYDSSLGDSQ
jgi:hypothetical protein